MTLIREWSKIFFTNHDDLLHTKKHRNGYLTSTNLKLFYRHKFYFHFKFTFALSWKVIILLRLSVPYLMFWKDIQYKIMKGLFLKKSLNACSCHLLSCRLILIKSFLCKSLRCVLGETIRGNRGIPPCWLQTQNALAIENLNYLENFFWQNIVVSLNVYLKLCVLMVF